MITILSNFYITVKSQILLQSPSKLLLPALDNLTGIAKRLAAGSIAELTSR